MQIQAAELLRGDGLAPVKNVALDIADGRIAAIEPSAGGDGRLLVLPALANAHDHARPLPMSSFGTAFMPLESWLPRTVFATPPDPYLAAAAPLARAALSGCASIMVHYTRQSGRYSPVKEARHVARAARDIGVRIAFAPAMRDINPLVFGEEDNAKFLAELPAEPRHAVERFLMAPPKSAEELVETTEAIAAEIEGPMVDVQFGPAGVQWCSTRLLETVAERSALTGRRVHMHFLETIYQRAYADKTFKQGVVRYLKDIGLLSERLALVHCVHVRPDELDLIAEAGATIVVNTSSNLALRSGIGPIAEAIRRGCKVAIGMDGAAIDEDDDMLREMRLTHHLHAGQGFEANWTPAQALRRFVREGRQVVGAPGTGFLDVGADADLLTIDLQRLDRDAIMPIPALDLLFSRGQAGHVDGLFVAGHPVVVDGRLTGVDLDAIQDELRRLFRHSVKSYSGLERYWPAVERRLSTYFRDHAACCS